MGQFIIPNLGWGSLHIGSFGGRFILGGKHSHIFVIKKIISY
jgi:hypothetical protein